MKLQLGFFSKAPWALRALTVVWIVGLLFSGYDPYDRNTWWMEVAPCFLALPALWLTARRFRFTSLCYVLITIHGLILMEGGAYTYARVPLGFWMQHWLDLTRNNYDKIGHFAQGFVPAFVAQEILSRHFRISSRALVGFLVVSICLAISAFYEFVEWWTALALGSGADEFLGTQGDPWDTQSDMFFAFLGACCAVALARWHYAAMKKLTIQTLQ